MGGSSRTITIKFDGSAKGLISSALAVSEALKRVGGDTPGLKKAQAEADNLSKKLDQTAKDAKEKGSLMGGALALGLSAAAPLVAGALVGGVALGFIGVAGLLQKNNAQVKQSFGNLKDQVVNEMKDASNSVVPYLVKAGNSLQQEFANLGPQLHKAFSAAGPDIPILVDGVNSLANNAMPGLVNAVTRSQPIMQGISHILGDLGTTATTVLNSLSSHSKEFGDDLDQVGSLISNVGSVAAGVLPGLASGFGTSVGSLNSLLAVLKPIAPAIGTITGRLLPAVGAFKLFGLATSPLNKLGSKIAGVASNLGGFTTKLTRSDTAGAKITTTTAKLGSALGKVGNALPLIGVGFAVVSEAMNAAAQPLDNTIKGLLTGGQAGQSAADDIAKSADALNHFTAGATNADSSAAKFTNTLNYVTKGLDPVQKATAIYNADLAHFGPNSSQAAAAQGKLSSAVSAAAADQERQNRSMETSNQLLSDHVNGLINAAGASLSLQGAVNSVTDSQTSYTDATKAASDAEKAYNLAVKKHGENSKQARAALAASTKATQDAKEASVSLQQALLAQINAAGVAAQAADKDGTAAQKAKDQTAGQTAAVLGLVEGYAKSGKTVPAALAQIASGLSKTQFQAAITTGQVEGVSRSLSKLPPGKSTTVKALTTQAIADLRAVGDKVTHLPNGSFKVTASTGAAIQSIQSVINRYNGKRVNIVVTTSGDVRALGAGKISARAKGGPVAAGVPYVVGDGGGPEIFVPHQSGRIVGTSESADILGGSGGSSVGGGDTFDLVFESQVLARVIDGRLRAHNRTLVSKVKAGAAAR